MDHVAIMAKQFGDLIAKIVNGEKKIESRWSINKITPWNKIHKGDAVWFKRSGGLVSAIAVVDKVMQFDNLDPEKISIILEKWGGKGGIDVNDLEKTKLWARCKKYCVLVFLRNPKKVKPFKINKEGFGSGCAWLGVENISQIKFQDSQLKPLQDPRRKSFFPRRVF